MKVLNWVILSCSVPQWLAQYLFESYVLSFTFITFLPLLPQNELMSATMPFSQNKEWDGESDDGVYRKGWGS